MPAPVLGQTSYEAQPAAAIPISNPVDVNPPPAPVIPIAPPVENQPQILPVESMSVVAPTPTPSYILADGSSRSALDANPPEGISTP